MSETSLTRAKTTVAWTADDERTRSSASALVSYVESLVDARDLDRAERFLHEELPIDARACELRRLDHQRGRIAFFRGRWNECAVILSRALEMRGPHVGLLADLCSALYLAGRSTDWHLAVERFAREFKLARELLSPLSRARTELTLGKHLEESGSLQDALDLYEDARASHDDAALKTASSAQLLRLCSFLGDQKRTARLYSELSGPRPPGLARAFEIDLEHALMSAEARDVGLRHALARLTSLRAKGLGPADMRLAVFDFVEIWLLDPHARSVVPESELRQLVTDALTADVPDAFDAAMASLVRSGRPDFVVLNSWLADAPTIGALRILAILAADETRAEARAELKRRMLLLMSGFDPRSARLLETKWASLLREQALEVELEPISRQVRCNGRCLSFARRRTAFEILLAIAERPSMTMDEFIRRIWNTGADGSYYDRARIAIRRLNRDLSTVVANPRIIETDPVGVRLTTGAKFRVSEA